MFSISGTILDEKEKRTRSEISRQTPDTEKCQGVPQKTEEEKRPNQIIRRIGKHMSKTKLPETCTLVEMSATYSQPADGDDLPENDQFLKLSTTDAGNGKYIVISTKRWAIDCPKDMEMILADFSERAGMNEEKEKE